MKSNRCANPGRFNMCSEVVNCKALAGFQLDWDTQSTRGFLNFERCSMEIEQTLGEILRFQFLIESAFGDPEAFCSSLHVLVFCGKCRCDVELLHAL